MSSLKSLAAETLARIHGTASGTALEQMEQAESCSSDSAFCSSLLEHENPQNIVAFGSCSTVPIPIHGTRGTRLPDDLGEGLRRLGMVRAPARVPVATWAEVVRDAKRLASDGWAVQALALGWDALSLWGVDTSADVHPWDESLAVILRGRRICAVDVDCVYIANPNGMHLFNRRARPGLTSFLWELGA